MLNNNYIPIDSDGIYLVNSQGKITNRKIIMKTYINNSGYECIKLSSLQVRKARLIHRLVAKAFIPNLKSRKEVNHIDGNKLNNNVCNLEWVSSSENKQHGIACGLITYNKPTLGLKKQNTKSNFHNVVWDKSRNRWIGVVRHNKTNHFPKRFNLEEDAALHVNWILDHLKLNDRPRNIV